MGYIRDGRIVDRRGMEGGREERDGGGGALSSGDTAATVELRNFGALRQSVSPSCAALRCGVEFQLEKFQTRRIRLPLWDTRVQQDAPLQVTDIITKSRGPEALILKCSLCTYTL